MAAVATTKTVKSNIEEENKVIAAFSRIDKCISFVLILERRSFDSKVFY